VAKVARILTLPSYLTKDGESAKYNLFLKVRTSAPDYNYYHVFMDKNYNILDGLVVRFNYGHEYKQAYDSLLGKVGDWMGVGR